MRILFLHTHHEAAAEYGVHQLLARYGRAYGVECKFICQQRADSMHTSDEDRASLYFDFGRATLVPRPPKARRAVMVARRLPSSLRFVYRQVQDWHPHIIYTSQQRHDLTLIRALRPWVQIPHLLHLHYTIGPWLGRAALRTILHSRHLFAVSDFVRTGAIAAGVQPNRIDRLFNPADVDQFSVPRERQTMGALFGWHPEAPVVVSAGRLDPGKGHPTLLEAFALVQQELPSARLLICGQTSVSTSYELSLKRRTNELGLSTAVVFAGHRTDLPALFAASDVFCLPTENEPFGLVFLEAMAAGLPVVACHSGGVPEIVQHGATGLLSSPGDPAALAAQLLILLRNRRVAEEMGTAGKRRAATAFSPMNTAARWVALLQQHFPSSGQE